MFLKKTRTTCVTKMRTYYIRKDKLIIMQNMVKQSEDETKNMVIAFAGMGPFRIASCGRVLVTWCVGL